MVRIRQSDLLETLALWTAIVPDQVPDLRLFDAHTHVGYNDPDGMHQSPEELTDALRQADAVGAFMFPFHEPDGYPSPTTWCSKRPSGPTACWCRSVASTRTTARSRRPNAASPPAPAGSSCTRAPSSSRSITPVCAR